jgi:hypothetical protein
MATPDELRMAQIEKEKADQRFWKIVQEAHKEQTEGHEKMAVTARAIAAAGRAMAAKAEARVARADDRIACLERGEALSEEVGKSAEYASAIRAFSSHEEHETRRVTRLRRKRGRPKEKKHRQALLVALYFMRNYYKRCLSVRSVAGEIYETVDIQSKHSDSGGYKSYKSPEALQEDLRLGCALNDEQMIAQMAYALVWWRKTHIDPKSGFSSGGIPYLKITPRNPLKLIRWIDAFLAAEGLSVSAAS